MFERLFREHPADAGETYFEHLRTAGGFGVTMIAAGAACLVHAIVPGLFVRTGSSAIGALHDRMVVNRRRAAVDRQPLQVAADA